MGHGPLSLESLGGLSGSRALVFGDSLPPRSPLKVPESRSPPIDTSPKEKAKKDQEEETR